MAAASVLYSYFLTIQVKLLEALHDHLKGLAADTSEVKPGRASQPGKSGDCADGDGVFLKTALLYLASDEVRFAFFIGDLSQYLHVYLLLYFLTVFSLRSPC